jgi:3-oxoadipate enol-lactonase
VTDTPETARIGPLPIVVDIAGEGPLVVLLHGIGGGRTNWRANIPALAAGFRVVAWDARGYGDSGDVPGRRRFDDFAADLSVVLDHFGAQRAHLVGLSMGGRIALRFRALHPYRVASLVLADTHLGFGALSDRERAAFLSTRRDPLLAGQTPADIAPGLARRLVGDPANGALIAEVVASLAALRADAYLRTIAASVDDDLDPATEGVGVPTLVVVGARDRVTPPALARELAGRIDGAELAILEGAGHLSNMEAPDAFNRAVLAFLARAGG